MKRVLGLLLCCACAEPTPGERVQVGLKVAATPSAFTRADGWSVQLDEARVMLGPLYLRAPKRAHDGFASSWLPRAHAHAQTLLDADVVGEYLAQLDFDALAGPRDAGWFESEARASDALSVVIATPRSADEQAHTRGHQAYVRGTARQGPRTVAFACGLTIGADARVNLEARRRVDRVPLAGVLAEGATMTLTVELARWLELVDFDAEPCGKEFQAQWYLGLRRPEAFRAEVREE
jgi:hypothetical protein